MNFIWIFWLLPSLSSPAHGVFLTTFIFCDCITVLLIMDSWTNFCSYLHARYCKISYVENPSSFLIKWIGLDTPRTAKNLLLRFFLPFITTTEEDLITKDISTFWQHKVCKSALVYRNLVIAQSFVLTG